MAVEAGGIGARLRAGREKLGLTVLQVAERIHTDPRIVEALEAENFPGLGAPVYARGHIRHYADLVGESAGELIGLYSNLSKVAQPDLTQIVKAPPTSESNRLVAPALIVIAVFAVAGAVWWVSALSKKKPQMAETHVVGDEASQSQTAATQPPETTATVPATSRPASAPAAALPRSVVPPVVTPPSKAQTQLKVVGSGAPSAATQQRPSTRPTPVTAAPAPPVTAANVPATAPASAPHAKNQAQVTLRYSADSWTEVYDASGTRLFYDVGSANSVQTVVGTPPLRVVLGNAAGVAVEFNGHNTPISKLSQPDGSVQFFLSRAGKAVRSKTVADGG